MLVAPVPEKATTEFVGDDGGLSDAKATFAASLAAEALRAAEEAKRAAERLAEVKASIALMGRLKTRPGLPEMTMDEILGKVEPGKQSGRDPPTYANQVRPEELMRTDPSGDNGSLCRISPDMPVQVIDNPKLEPETETRDAVEESEGRKLEREMPVQQPSVVAQEVAKHAQEVVKQNPIAQKLVVAPAPVSPQRRKIVVKEDDLFVSILDAIGVGRLCGVDDLVAGEPPTEVLKTHLSNRSFSGIKPGSNPGSVSGSKAGAPNGSATHPPQIMTAASGASVSTAAEAFEQLSPIKKQILARRRLQGVLAQGSADPFAGDLAINHSESVTSSVTAGTNDLGLPSLPSKHEPSTAGPQVANQNTGVTPAVTTTPPVTTPVVSKPVEEQRVPPTSAHTRSTRSVSSNRSVDFVEPVAKEGVHRPVSRNRIPPSSSKLSTSGLSALKKDILVRRHRNSLLNKPDPFEGEHDDFFACGKMTSLSPRNEPVQQDEDPETDSVCCGWL